MIKYRLLGSHESESVEVGERLADLSSGELLGPVALRPLLVDLGLSPGLLDRRFARAMRDFDAELGQVKRLDVQGFALEVWSINESLLVVTSFNHYIIIIIKFPL